MIKAGLKNTALKNCSIGTETEKANCRLAFAVAS